MNAGENQLAKKNIEESLKIDSESIYGNYYFALYYFNIGEIDKACLFLQKSLEKGLAQQHTNE